MLSATLDTSCALNFLGEDAETSDALIDLVAAAMVGRINLRVTDQAHEEVSRTADDEQRRERLKRLRTFGRVEIEKPQHESRDARGAELLQALFPDSQSDSNTRITTGAIASNWRPTR